MQKNPYLHHSSSNTPKVLGFIILVVFIFALGWHVGAGQARQGQAPFAAEKQVGQGIGSDKVDMQLFWDVWGLLAGRYVDPNALDYKNMIYGAIRGMVFSLGDPYTTFLTPKENREFQESMNGTLEGIGAELTLRDGMITVVSPLKGSPAKQAGLQPEDVIIKVDGEDVTNFTLEQVVMRIRGPKGTKVKLTIGRKGENEPFDVDIVRQTINISSVEWKMIDSIADIELNQFGGKTKEEFTKAINEILLKRPKGIVLDLRYNGGGYLDGAVDIVSEFVEKGKVVSVKKRNSEEDEVIYVTGKARVAKVPMVVLINKGSASASEIVAGAIRDSGRGIAIGETSFGKGTVQEVENLIDGSSLRVTIAKWYTPNNVNISAVGITPDIVVARTIEDMKANRDPQLDAALSYLKKK
ncbi:S41 family peptidase [Candidatus Peregrinibacteria bacterium]|nr:S41 family peptidase [Candidatus Peregrinibacteria bacterium]